MNKKTQAPFYYIGKPEPKKIKNSNVIQIITNEQDFFKKWYEKVNQPKYVFWDKFKYLFNETGFKAEEVWTAIDLIRSTSSKYTPIKAEDNRYFKWNRLQYTDEYLHKIDMHSGGTVLPKFGINPLSNETLIARGIIEEAIASSQLEGAHTTRKAARKLILEKKRPKNESEWMILNNYQTIMAIEEDYKDQKLSVELLFNIHKQLTNNTVPQSEQNRFRKNKDNIVVQGYIGAEEYVTHIPPKEKFLASEIDELIKFANDEDGREFIHPIIKSIMIHFWVGYLHPFTDGNGRLARALFYWYLLRKGYWTFMYLPISSVIKKAPSQYAMAYINSEQNNLDFTYFYDFHMRKIIQALDEFESYINTKVEENLRIERILSKNITLNDRQKNLLYYMVSDENPSATISTHKTLNKLSRQSAAKDLKELEKYGFIKSKREGKGIRFYPTKKILELSKK